MIPLPTASQLRVEGKGRTLEYYLGYRRVGIIDGRVLRKTITGSHQLFRRRPGVGWNLELLAIAERSGVDSVAVELVGQVPGVFHLGFWIIERFVQAALEGDKRYLLNWDEDTQVLIPWAAWKGEITGPPEKKKKVPETQGKLL